MDRSALAIEVSTFWTRVVNSVSALNTIDVVRQMSIEAERHRRFADYDTGSITGYEAFCLLALAEYLHAKVVIEVGTFVGLSTMALAEATAVEAVYTCDASNDCLKSTETIRTYPRRTSTDMLRDLAKRQVRADLCFFDGVLMPPDVDLLQRVTHPETVYAFHDYNYGPKIRKGGTREMMPRKGIGNVRALQPVLYGYVLIEPQPETTLALLVPELRL